MQPRPRCPRCDSALLRANEHDPDAAWVCRDDACDLNLDAQRRLDAAARVDVFLRALFLAGQCAVLVGLLSLFIRWLLDR